MTRGFGRAVCRLMTGAVVWARSASTFIGVIATTVGRRRLGPWTCVTSVMLLLVMAAPLVQAAEALSLDQALRLAQDRSRQLTAQDAAVAGALQMAVGAGQRPDPTLRLSLDALPINGADRYSTTRDDFTMRTIGVTQEFIRDDKRRARSARYEREAQVAQAGRARALSALQRDTATAWFERHYAQSLHELLSVQRGEVGLQVDAAEAAYRGGRGSQADVFAARSAAEMLDDKLDQSERQQTIASTQLARWIGDAARRPLALVPTAATETVGLSEGDLQERLAHHPEIAVLVQKEGIAQAEVELAQANKRADWSVGVSFAKRGPAYSDYLFISASVPLQWDQKDRQDREVAARLAVLDQLRAEREEATRGHVAETLSMLQEWQSNRKRLKRFDATLIPLAAERTRAATSVYRGGGSTLAAVLEVRRAEIETRIDRLRLEAETQRLWARLNYLIPVVHDASSASRSTP